MDEPKKPRKSYISFWLIALAVFILLQMFVFPRIFSQQVTQVSYDTFISMTEQR